VLCPWLPACPWLVPCCSWAGVPLRDVLERAGAPTEGVRVHICGADGQAQRISIETAMSRASFLAHEWEGEPLPTLHGFPVCAVLPEVNGNYWSKWVYLIEIV